MLKASSNIALKRVLMRKIESGAVRERGIDENGREVLRLRVSHSF